MKKKSIRCPYCGGTAVLRDASYVYGGESGRKHLYVCQHYPECNSYGELVPIEYRLLGENSDYVYLLYFASDVQYDHENEEQVNTYEAMREDLYNIKFEILHKE